MKRIRTMIRHLTRPNERSRRAGWHVRSWPRRTAAALLGLGIVVGATAGLGQVANADSKDISMYAVASSATSFFMNAITPGSSQAHDNWTAILGSPATAGGVVGYWDPDFSVKDAGRWLVSQTTGTSTAVTYESMRKAGSDYSGVAQYAEFGATLSSLGLDSTGSGLAPDLLRWIGGAIVLAAYSVSAAVDWMFNIVLSVLVALNPFRLFYAGVHLISPSFADGMTGGDTSAVWLPLRGVADFLSGVYKAVSDLSWTVLVPLFFAVTFFGFFMGKGKGGFRKLIIRVLFIVFGVPLLGSMYTGMLTGMQDATSGGDSGATQIVASTFVDFGAWSTKARLAVPEGATIAWDETRGAPTESSASKVQDTTLAINKMLHPEWRSMVSPFSLSTSVNWTQAAQGTTGGSLAARNTGWDMLLRYTIGDKVTASSFASDVQGALTGNSAASKWFSSVRVDDPNNTVQTDTDPGVNPLLNVAASSGLHASVSSGVVTYSTPSISQNAVCGSLVVSGDGRSSLPCNLSALATYNYLTSSFDSTGVTNYSASKASSMATLVTHNSVTLIGTGMMSFVYWLEAVVLMISFSVIGIGYAASMFAGNLKHGLQMVAAVPFAMMGAISGIAKVLVYTMAMVMELLATLFLYKIVQEILMVLPKILYYLLALTFDGQSINTGAGGAIVGGAARTAAPEISTALVMGGQLLIVVLVIVFTVMAMRLRKSVVKAITEVTTKIVESLTGSAATPPGGHSGTLMSAAAGGIGAGAGSALGGRMMGGNKSSAAASEKGGPEAASASGTTDVGAGDGQAPEATSDGADGPDGTPSGGGGPLALSSPMPALTGGADLEIGAKVEQDGLTQNPAGPAAAPSAGADASGPAAGTDAVDTVAGSMNQTAQQQKAADKQRLTGAADGVKAGVHAGVAAGAAVSGNAQMALDHGQKAVGAAQRSASGTQAANATEQAATEVRPPAQPQQRPAPAGQAGPPPAVPSPHPTAGPPQSTGGFPPRPQPAPGGARRLLPLGKSAGK